MQSYIRKHGDIKILHFLYNRIKLCDCLASIIGKDIPNNYIALF